MKKIFSSVMTLILAIVAVSCGGNATSEGRKAQELSGAGATFPLPFYNVVFEEFAQVNGDAVAYGGIGSGGGVRNLRDKIVDFAGSDAFLSDKEMSDMNAVIHVPTCMGAVVVAYNLDGVKDLMLTGEVIADIFAGAFNPQAFTGGVVGSLFVSMQKGVSRGIFSNEAGVGSAAMVHCGAKVDHPVEQGLWGAVEVFLDTVLVCLVSALTVVLSGLWNTGLDGAVLTMEAFEMLLPGKIGSYICLGAIILFGFTCLISFYTYAERGAVFLFGQKSRFWIKLIWVGMIFLGSQTTLGFAWDLADTINGMMIIPNLIGLLLLSGEVVKLKKEYFADRLPAHKK